MNSSVGAKIKYLRKKHKLTQSELAEKLGVVPTAVSAWERGSNRPMVDKLSMMADLFSVNLLYFYGDDDENEVKGILDDQIVEAYGNLTVDQAQLFEKLLDKAMSLDGKEREKFFDNVRLILRILEEKE